MGLPGSLWRRLPLLCLAWVLCIGAGMAATDGPIRLQIVGGLAGITQFNKLEKPFWEKEIAERSGGRIAATIKSFDAGGLRGQEMLQLMRLGVVPFGTVLLSIASGDDPELNAVDLPVLNPDMKTLRRTLGLFREHLGTVLRTRYGIELLAVYAYPAQVLYCDKPFTGLDDLAGRKVRTSSIAQFELMTALNAVPVVVPFAEMTNALRDGVVDCAITGTLSGYEIGLPNVTTHVHAMAISWGLSFFGANLAAWKALPPDVQEIIRTGVADLEQRIWRQAEADTERGLACNTGKVACAGPPERPMTLVPTSRSDEARRTHLLREVVLPRWIERCGEGCVKAWNTYFAPTLAIEAKAK
ncbi:TRAP transporter substrate-binding protein [Ancylobacter sp. 3268]|uniref:TRAP transporter substrate-binding protein n=1 Tax=Ancylobacter sp. 3268 TaxID=2817752 RepID=UPI00286B2305|nr:TRAP transporter substrate-binding protein [Ancylobacter sp. 3268]